GGVDAVLAHREGAELVARKLEDHARTVAGVDAVEERGAVRADQDGAVDVEREGEEMILIRVEEDARLAAPRIDGEELALRTGRGDQRLALLVVGERPDVLGAFELGELARLARAIDREDAGVGERARVERPVGAEGERGDEE